MIDRLKKPEAIDPVAQRRAELARRLAALSPEQRSRLSERPAAGTTPRRTIPRRQDDGPAPLSFAQELLWRLEVSNPGFAYNVPRAIRLGGTLDVSALERAINALVVRHEALRTTFDWFGEEPAQFVHPPRPIELTIVNVSQVPQHEREQAARSRMRELTRTHFDLSKDAQLRAWLIRLAPDDHVLLLLSHHVSSDGWSGNILMRELSALYDGFRNDTPVELPDLPLRYVDYAAWQRESLSGKRLDDLLAFWRTQLEGAPAVLDVPTDRPRPTVPGFDGGIRALTLPRELVDQLQAFNAAQGTTSFMVLLSALYVLIYRYSANAEIVVGTPIAGRSQPELEGVVGFFSNTLLLRASLAGNPTFAELLARVREMALNAFDHQEIPLETLLSARNGDKPLATMPQFVLSTEDPDRERLKLSGTSGVAMRESFGSTKFDFMLSSAERPDGLKVAAEYRTDLFDAATIDRMLQHFGVLLQAGLSLPETRIDDLPILTELEQEQVKVQWNDTAAGYPQDATIRSLIERQVAQRPDAVAIEIPVAGNRTRLTYRELDHQANRIAWALVDAGVVPDDRVAVCLDRTAEMITTIVGVLKAGGAYLPIDPAYPDDRIEYTVRDAGARILVVDESNYARIKSLAIDARIITTSELNKPADKLKSELGPDVQITPDNLAYVIYTSGSTGRPKGVMVEHRNVTRLLVNNRSQFDFGEHDVWTIFHSFAFDFSVWEMYGALIFGGRAVIVPRLVAQSPTDFLGLLESTGTTILNQVPSAFYPLMEQAVAFRPNLKLRYIIFGGEALKPAKLRAWREAWPETKLINMFGITETTVHVTYKEIGDAEIAAGVSNIGRPIPTLTTYILDRQLKPVPIGVTGEICVGGLGVARGYLNRPELTAEKFVADPFGPGKRLYRSGDLGRLLPNGEIEYLGRRDHQVKLRGHRIELGEIETVLLQHPEVTEAVAIVREDVPGDQRLVAYIVSATSPPPEIGALRDWLRKSLPEVMVPASFMFLDRIPLTSNGKADRNALPIPQGSLNKRPYQRPRGTIEHEVAQIWEKLLSLGQRVSAYDDFFELGGHSLLAIRMLAEIERVRGQRVPLAWLFESSTLEKLAARLKSATAPEDEPPLIVLQPEGKEPPISFVHGDWSGGGWYVRRLAPLFAPDSPFYLLPTLGKEEGDKPWTIESMAARHVIELAKVQPVGPYRLYGYCIGGVVAFEMACQLRAAGHEIESLVLIDSAPMNARLRSFAGFIRLLPGLSERGRLRRRASVMRAMRWIDSRVRYFNKLSFTSKGQFLWAKLVRSLPQRVLAASEAIGSGATTLPQQVRANDGVERDALLTKAQSTAASAYIPRQFDGVIEFFWAQGIPGIERRTNPIAYWKLLAPEVRLTAIASGHRGLITNNLPLLADALRSHFRGSGQPR